MSKISEVKYQVGEVEGNDLDSILDYLKGQLPEGVFVITKDEWHQAFHKAEGETSEQYNQQTCSLTDREGNQTCPICYFSKRMKIHLGIEQQ